MNKFLKLVFVVVIAAMSCASLLQLLAPDFMGSQSAYGISRGWQREIAFWDIAVVIILMAVLMKYDWFYLRAVLLGLIIGGLGIGSNHLVGFIQAPSQYINLIGAVENYLLVLAWILGWRLEKRKHH
ncbi:hypothetical protein ACVR1G_04150 [Streptococcus dentasini]